MSASLELRRGGEDSWQESDRAQIAGTPARSRLRSCGRACGRSVAEMSVGLELRRTGIQLSGAVGWNPIEQDDPGRPHARGAGWRHHCGRAEAWVGRSWPGMPAGRTLGDGRDAALVARMTDRNPIEQDGLDVRSPGGKLGNTTDRHSIVLLFVVLLEHLVFAVPPSDLRIFGLDSFFPSSRAAE